MTTFSTLVAGIVNKYKGSTSSTFTTQAEDEVNAAIQFYQTEHFWFTEGVADLTLTIDDPEITTATGFPSDFWYLQPDGPITVIDGYRRYVLEKISKTEYDQRNKATSSRPDFYMEEGGLIQVLPYPQEEYAALLRYVKKYAPLSGSDSNDFTIYAPQLIEARALARLFLSQGHDGDTMRVFWEAEESRQLTALRITNYRRTTTGKLD